MIALNAMRRFLPKLRPIFFKFSSSDAAWTQQNNPSRSATSSTIDKRDVEHLANFGNSWWDTTGDLRALHSFNPLRIEFIRTGLINTGHQEVNTLKPLEGVEILDVGCGGGILSEPLARLGAKVTGIDASKDLIDLAQDHLRFDKSLESKIEYIYTTVEDWKENNKDKYQVVVASEILDHVFNPELFLSSCCEVLRPNGSIFVTTLNRTRWSYGGIIATEYILGVLPKGSHDWNKFVTPEETKEMLENYNCKTRFMHGTLYNPLTNNWSWTPMTDLTYALQAVKDV